MPGTVANLLDLIATLNNESDVTAGGADEGRAVKALMIAQHYFETIAASLPRVLASTIQVVTAASAETTTFPSTLLRMDGLWFLDPTTNLPIYKLKRILEAGGHVPTLPFPLDLSLNTGTGAPAAYFSDMASFYWLPLPQGVSNVRVYGLVEQPEFVDRNSTYNYPLRTKFALAAFAAGLLNVAVDDGKQDLDDLATKTFGPLLRSIRKFDRTEPMPRLYNEMHDT